MKPCIRLQGSCTMLHSLILQSLVGLKTPSAAHGTHNLESCLTS